MKRFISMDPLGFVDSMNLYETFGCDPINNTDRFGLTIVSDESIHDIIYEYGVRQAPYEFQTGPGQPIVQGRVGPGFRQYEYSGPSIPMRSHWRNPRSLIIAQMISSRTEYYFKSRKEFEAFLERYTADPGTDELKDYYNFFVVAHYTGGSFFLTPFATSVLFELSDDKEVEIPIRGTCSNAETWQLQELYFYMQAKPGLEASSGTEEMARSQPVGRIRFDDRDVDIWRRHQIYYDHELIHMVGGTPKRTLIEYVKWSAAWSSDKRLRYRTGPGITAFTEKGMPDDPFKTVLFRLVAKGTLPTETLKRYLENKRYTRYDAIIHEIRAANEGKQ